MNTISFQSVLRKPALCRLAREGTGIACRGIVSKSSAPPSHPNNNNTKKQCCGVMESNQCVCSHQRSYVHTMRECNRGSTYNMGERGEGLDASEFGYRVVSPLHASRYTATACQAISDGDSVTTTSRTVDTLGMAGSATTHLLSTSYLNNPEEIIATQEEWDSVLEGETMKPRQERMKEDPYLSDYEAVMQPWGLNMLGKSILVKVDEEEDEGRFFPEDDWDAACEVDF